MDVQTIGLIPKSGPKSGPARIALGLVAVQWAVLSFLVDRQLRGQGTNSWDLGIFNQAVYQMARGRSFMSYRGMDIFGHHVHPAVYVLAPVSWLGGGARALSLIQVAALCLGAWPAYLLGRDRVSDTGEPRPKLGLLVAAVYLLHPMVTGLSWWMFHPESLAVAAILGSWWAATAKRWGVFTGCVVWAMLCREDIALAMTGLGLAVCWTMRADRRARRAGGIAGLAALCYWVVITQVVMPARLGTREPYYVQDFWGHLGSTMPEVLATAVRHPDRALAGVRGQSGVEFGFSLLGPTGALAVFNPVTLIGAGPQLLAVTLSNDPDSRQPWHHHTTIVMPFMIISMAETLRRLDRRSPRFARTVSGWLLVSSSLSYVVMSPTPIGPFADRWVGQTEQSVVMHEVAEKIPKDATVVATVTPGNLLTNRETIYTWPNPFVRWKRGFENLPLPDSVGVDYLVVVEKELGKHRALFEEMTGRNGDFRVQSNREGVIVAIRAPGRIGTSPGHPKFSS